MFMSEVFMSMAAAQIAQAVRAFGAIVKVEPDQFLKILNKSSEPLVVSAPVGFWSSGFRYLTGYKGLIFFTTANHELPLPNDVELVVAKKIIIPG